MCKKMKFLLLKRLKHVRIGLMKNRNLAYRSDLLQIKIKYQERQTKIYLKVDDSILITNDLPLTHDILQAYLPGIFKSKCFNNGELPFKIEVKNTELGHLFEHIILEYLCIFKIKSGKRSANYCGETCWNWKKDPRGLFKITLNAPLREKKIFLLALNESICLLNFILSFSNHQKVISGTDWSLFSRLSFLGRSTSGSLATFLADTAIKLRTV
jgi:hypothetical protein